MKVRYQGFMDAMKVAGLNRGAAEAAFAKQNKMSMEQVKKLRG